MNNNQNLTEAQSPINIPAFDDIYDSQLASDVAHIIETNSFPQKLRSHIIYTIIGVFAGTFFLIIVMTIAGFADKSWLAAIPIFMVIFLASAIDNQYQNIRAVLIIGYFFMNFLGIFPTFKLVDMGMTSAGMYYFCFMMSVFVGIIFFYRRLKAPYQEYLHSSDEKYTNILKKLVKAFDENMTYTPEHGISKQEFMAAQLFYHEGKTYRAYNLVERTQGQPQFKFSHVYLNEGKKKSLKAVQDMEMPIDSIFIIADIEKELQGITVIKPKNVVGSIARDLANKIWKSDDNKTLVDIEHDEFNKHFTVHSDYPLESMEILTPDFMERLMALQRKILPDSLKKGGELNPHSAMLNLSISIQNKKIYLYPNLQEGKRIILPVKIFKVPKSWKQANIRNRLKKDYEYLQKIFEIVTELQLR